MAGGVRAPHRSHGSNRGPTERAMHMGKRMSWRDRLAEKRADAPVREPPKPPKDSSDGFGGTQGAPSPTFRGIAKDADSLSGPIAGNRKLKEPPICVPPKPPKAGHPSRLTLALAEARPMLAEYRTALRLGTLMLCANCSHFSAGADPSGIGRCSRFKVEAWPFAPFWCAGFERSKSPPAPEFAP